MSNSIVFDKTHKDDRGPADPEFDKPETDLRQSGQHRHPGLQGKGGFLRNRAAGVARGADTSMVRSNDRHMAPDDPLQAMETPEVVESGPVDLDTQMVNLTKNSIEYQHMVGMLNKKFTMLKTAITEGGV